MQPDPTPAAPLTPEMPTEIESQLRRNADGDIVGVKTNVWDVLNLALSKIGAQSDALVILEREGERLGERVRALEDEHRAARELMVQAGRDYLAKCNEVAALREALRGVAVEREDGPCWCWLVLDPTAERCQGQPECKVAAALLTPAGDRP